MTADTAPQNTTTRREHDDVSYQLQCIDRVVNSKEVMGSQRNEPCNDDDPGPAAA